MVGMGKTDGGGGMRAKLTEVRRNGLEDTRSIFVWIPSKQQVAGAGSDRSTHFGIYDVLE